MLWGTHFFNSGVITNPFIRDAMDSVEREDFLPFDKQHLADEDRPIEIGFGQTNSQPYTVAFMLNLLDSRPGQKILDIGSGSGWTSAILAWIVSGGTHPVPMKHRDTPLKRGSLESPLQRRGGSQSDGRLGDAQGREADGVGFGKVYAVERIPELVKFGEESAGKYSFTRSHVLTFIHSDGSHGLPEHAPYDRILASAAFQTFPEKLADQLTEGGILVAPIGDGIVRVFKDETSTVSKKIFPGFVFVPMIGDNNSEKRFL